MKTLILFFTAFLTVNSAIAQFSDLIVIDSANSALKDICTGDINNDGLPDIILSKAYWENKISYYINEGNGNFGEEKVVAQVSSAFFFNRVASADFNTDSFDDIVTFIPGANNDVSLVFFPNNAGGFADPVILDTGLSAQNEIICADIDNDSDMDVIADDDISIRVYRNDGQGNFTGPDIIAAEDEYYDISVADFNGDGFVDIISAGGNHISLFWNDGGGNFPAIDYIENPLYGLPFTVESGDLDGDMDNDFVMYYEWIEKLAWYSNDGTGDFSLEQEIFSTRLNHTLQIKDVELDGDLDILTATNQESSVIWFENDGSGTFSDEQIIYQFIQFNFIESICVIDLDNDGDEEVIWGAVSDALVFQDNLTNIVSIVENNMSSDVILFPNPAQNFVNVKSGNIIKTIQVYNHAGQLVKNIEPNSQLDKINIQSFPSGLYFLLVNTSNAEFIEKIIINH